jgi:uncharacterized protein (DUF427 family)
MEMTTTIRPASALASNPAPGFRDHPDRKITVEPFKGTVEVSLDGKRIARSSAAVILREGNYPPVHYIPLSDVDPATIRKSDHRSHCPFKGRASYWNVVVGEHEIDNAMWSYETPYDEMLEIAGLVAFYPNKVDVKVS